MWWFLFFKFKFTRLRYNKKLLFAVKLKMCWIILQSKRFFLSHTRVLVFLFVFSFISHRLGPLLTGPSIFAIRKVFDAASFRLFTHSFVHTQFLFIFFLSFRTTSNNNKYIGHTPGRWVIALDHSSAWRVLCWIEYKWLRHSNRFRIFLMIFLWFIFMNRT